MTVAVAFAPRRFFLCFYPSEFDIAMDQLSAEISCSDLKTKLAQEQPLLLLDCRQQHEHELACISGSTLLPMDELVHRQSEIAGLEDRHTVVYCHLGIRSLQVAAWLREHGFTRVQSLAGGIDAWAVEIDSKMARY